VVEHHLAKVRVAGSNPVIRSEELVNGLPRWSGREARQGTANPCTRVQIPSPPRNCIEIITKIEQLVRRITVVFYNGRLAQLASALP